MGLWPAGGGLSFFDANSGRLVTEGPDVLGVKAEIEARWPDSLSVWFDTDELMWKIVEKCTDGVERLVLKTTRLDMGVVQKLDRIDQAKHRQGDINAKLEREHDQAEREKDHQFSEEAGDGIERLYHALRKDGVIHRPQVFFGEHAA